MSPFSSSEKLVTTLGAALLRPPQLQVQVPVRGPGQQQQQHAPFPLAAVNGEDHQAAPAPLLVAVVQDGGPSYVLVA